MKDVVRDLSPSGVNKAVDEATLATLERYKNASPEAIEARIDELERMWDIECHVELWSSLLTLGGIGLGFRSKRLLWFPLAVQGLVFARSFPIPDPLTPFLRLFGVWTRQEIEREKQALKLLRGDYERVAKDPSAKSALAAAQGSVGHKEATGAGKSTRRTAKPREARKPDSEALGEDLRPKDAPTVSGPSGDPERLH